YIHHLVETLKLAFADRHELYGDPNFVDVPMEQLLNGSYAKSRHALVDPAAAFPGMPPAGLPSNWRNDPEAKPDDGPPPGPPDTSYCCVVDSKGNAFSATPSDGCSDSPVIPGLGFAPSSRGTQSWTDPRAPAVLGPGRRPRLTPSPAFVRL